MKTEVPLLELYKTFTGPNQILQLSKREGCDSTQADGNLILRHIAGPATKSQEEGALISLEVGVWPFSFAFTTFLGFQGCCAAIGAKASPLLHRLISNRHAGKKNTTLVHPPTSQDLLRSPVCSWVLLPSSLLLRRREFRCIISLWLLLMHDMWQDSLGQISRAKFQGESSANAPSEQIWCSSRDLSVMPYFICHKYFSDWAVYKCSFHTCYIISSLSLPDPWNYFICL